MLTDGSLCPKSALYIKDALEAVEGKWKLLILFSLSAGPKRFTQLAKEVTGITDKTLSKELKLLESYTLITRTAVDSFPPTVEYAITERGRSLEKVMDELHDWGVALRKDVIGK
jgi:DNA-binding HxlR family transcriptional regulator